MAPYSWILACLTLFKQPDNKHNLIEKPVSFWTGELKAGEEMFGGISMDRGIFQRDLSPDVFTLVMTINCPEQHKG